MGSFNVACSVSNISIGCGTPIVYIPLEKSQFPNGPEKNNMMIYTHCVYSPLALPVFGDYDDYGGIENIEEGDSTKAIEDWFKMDIAKFCDFETMPSDSGMYVHREIWDLMVNKFIDEGGKNNKGEYGSPSIEKHLKWLAEWKEKLEGPSCEELTDYRLECVKTKENGTEEEAMVALVKYEEIISHLPIHHVYVSHILDAGMFREYKTFPKIYSEQVKQGKLFQELAEFMQFICSMGAVNAHFFPAANGYQCGNPYMSRRLYLKAAAITRESLKDRERW